MAILGLFLKSIFLVAILTAVFILGIVVYLYLRIKRVARNFSASATGGGRQQSSGGRASGNASDNKREEASFVNEELYDERSPHEANRKIFAKDEGEYVDFEEEK